MMGAPGDVDLWDAVQYPPEGERIRDEREKVRAEVEARDARVAAVKAKAAAAGWTVHVVDAGPKLQFGRWGRTIDHDLERAERFVETLPRVSK